MLTTNLASDPPLGNQGFMLAKYQKNPIQCNLNKVLMATQKKARHLNLIMHISFIKLIDIIA